MAAGGVTGSGRRLTVSDSGRLAVDVFGVSKKVSLSKKKVSLSVLI